LKPKGKCFCRKCEDCHWLWDWDMTNDEGLRSVKKRCLFQVLGEEIPKIRGSIDGCQGATNETRNHVLRFGKACAESFSLIMDNTKKMITHADS